jgi:hypothetical protein
LAGAWEKGRGAVILPYREISAAAPPDLAAESFANFFASHFFAKPKEKTLTQLIAA